MKNILVKSMALIIASVFALPVMAGETKSPFTLNKYVPENTWLYMHEVHNSERDFLEKHWSHVWEEVKNAKLDHDIKNLILGNLANPEDQLKFEDNWNRISNLLEKIQWKDLTGNESVLFSQNVVPIPDLTLLFRGKDESIEGNFKYLKSILVEIAKLDETIKIDTIEKENATSYKLSFGGLPVSICLFKHKDVIGITTSEQNIDIVLNQTGLRLVKTDRFKQALSKVPLAEDSIVFIDSQRLFSSIRSFIDTIRAANEIQEIASAKDSEDNENAEDSNEEMHIHEEPAGLKIATAILDNLDIVDYKIITEETKGNQTYEHVVAIITEEGKNKPLYKVFSNQKQISDYGKLIPEDALGFWAFSGINVNELYGFIKGMILQHAPDGEQILADWETEQQDNDFNLQHDFLDWISGQMVFVKFAPTTQSFMGSNPDMLFMLKVKDDQKASDTIFKYINKMNSGLDETQSKPIMITDASDVNAEGFKSIAFMMMPMIGKFTIGVNNGWLIVSNSTSAINKSLATQSGEAKSFLSTEKFKKEGLSSTGPVCFASFTNLENASQELAMGLGMAQMSIAMMMPVPQTPEEHAIKTLLGMVGKLTPAILKMNFTLSNSSICKFNDDQWNIKVVTTYKEYTPPEERKPEETNATPKAKSSDGL